MAKKSTQKDINTMNETGRRGGERRQQDRPVGEDRRKVQRRRQIDPTTCERDYSEKEIEFMQALDEYKRKNGRMFPTCSEILEVIEQLGYRKAGQPGDSQDQSAAAFTEASTDMIEEASKLLS